MSGLRVLLVNDDAPGPTGGVEVHLERLARGLAAAGDTVELFAGEVAHRGPAKVLDVWDPWARRRLAERALAFRPDVVHHHNVVRELSPSVLGVPRGVPCVLTLHDHRLLGVADGRGIAHRARTAKAGFDRWVIRRRVDALVAVSQPLADAATAARLGPVHVLAPFVDAPPPGCVQLGPESCTDVVAAGRFSPDKGFHVLVEAFGAIAGRHPQARLVIAGDGPERDRLLALARSLGVPLVLPGRLLPSEVLALLAGARVVVAPSLPTRRPEGAGMTVLEAGAVGRPVIVSDDPALRATAESAGEPVVVPAGDARALADALDGLLADPARAARLGAAGRAASSRHRTEQGVDALRRLYRDVARR